MNKEVMEYLHDRGSMPDWAYYQQNGKTITENYAEIRRKRQEQRRIQKEAEEQLEKEFEEKAEEVIEKTLEELLDKLNK